jgi:hypothetical protein
MAMTRYPPAAKRQPGDREPYAAVNELVEAFTLDHRQMRAAEPFAPDFWVPGHSYRENLVLLGGLRQSDTASANRRCGADAHFRSSCQRQRLMR